MALELDFHVGEKFYVMSENGSLLEMEGVEIVGGNKMTMRFTCNANIEILREKLLMKIISKNGKYAYPSMKSVKKEKLL